MAKVLSTHGSPTPKELSVMAWTTRRPVSIIVWNSKTHYSSNYSDQQWEELVVTQRNQFTAFSQKHPEYSLRYYELDPGDDASRWDAILADMIKDVNEERGVHFGPPKESPWNAPNKQYCELNIQKKATIKKPGFWKNLIGVLVGH